MEPDITNYRYREKQFLIKIKELIFKTTLDIRRKVFF